MRLCRRFCVGTIPVGDRSVGGSGLGCFGSVRYIYIYNYYLKGGGKGLACL